MMKTIAKLTTGNFPQGDESYDENMNDENDDKENSAHST